MRPLHFAIAVQQLRLGEEFRAVSEGRNRQQVLEQYRPGDAVGALVIQAQRILGVYVDESQAAGHQGLQAPHCAPIIRAMGAILAEGVDQSGPPVLLVNDRHRRSGPIFAVQRRGRDANLRREQSGVFGDENSQILISSRCEKTGTEQ
jgi:hypothetical protein